MRSAHYGRFQTEIRKNMLETAELRCDRPVKGRPHLLGRVITRPRPAADEVSVRNTLSQNGYTCFRGMREIDSELASPFNQDRSIGPVRVPGSGKNLQIITPLRTAINSRHEPVTSSNFL